MLSYDRQIKPGLVALYDIWSGNRAGLSIYSYNSGTRMGHFLRGSFLANHLENTDNLTSTIKR